MASNGFFGKLLLCLSLCSILGQPAMQAEPVNASTSKPAELFLYNFEPDLVTPGVIANCVKRLGATTSADGRRRFGFSTQICILKQPTEETVEYVQNALRESEENNVPVAIRLMGDRFWDNRPELWNWWAPDQPGFNPKNIENVEWYGWGKENAVKMGWVKWGPGSFIPLVPSPNLASPAYIAANKKELDVLLPIIVKWQENLPADRKDLMAGIVFGWEMQADHLGAFYKGYEKDDIYTWLKRPSTDRPETMGEPIQLGFSAATTLGLQGGKGSLLTDDTVAEIMRYYFEAMADIAVAHGIPEEKIMLHGVGLGEKNHGTLLRRYPKVIPGWTTYAAQPFNFEYLIDSRGDLGWNAIEFGGVVDVERFKHYFNAGCRVMNLYSRNAHQMAVNNRTVRQWLGYPAIAPDPLKLPFSTGFEDGLKEWATTSGKGQAVRSDQQAYQGKWSMFTGPGCAADLVFFEEPRPAVVEFSFLNAMVKGETGLADFRGDWEPNLRLSLGGGKVTCQAVGEKKSTPAFKLAKGWHKVRAVFDGKEAKIYVDDNLLLTDPKMPLVREITFGMFWNIGTGLYWDHVSVKAVETPAN